MRDGVVGAGWFKLCVDVLDCDHGATRDFLRRLGLEFREGGWRREENRTGFYLVVPGWGEFEAIKWFVAAAEDSLALGYSPQWLRNTRRWMKQQMVVRCPQAASS
jgi:hypothetical protein